MNDFAKAIASVDREIGWLQFIAPSWVQKRTMPPYQAIGWCEDEAKQLGDGALKQRVQTMRTSLEDLWKQQRSA